jgi:hypothetical protein
MKRKFIMMSVLIQGPKQPSNDIDVYLRPLVEKLLQLWQNEGVRVWDEHKQEDAWPALSNLSGQINKGYNACTHYLRLKVYIWINVRIMCIWGIVDFFRPGIP